MMYRLDPKQEIRVENQAETTEPSPEAAKKSRRRRVAHLAVVCVLAALVATAVGILRWRIELSCASVSTISDPQPVDASAGSSGDDAVEALPDGSILATVGYTVSGSKENSTATTQVTWNDDWFFADSAAYNHELAQAAAAISCVANGESYHFFDKDAAPSDHMQALFSKLGFEYASTASYRFRSTVIDQVARVFDPSGINTTAYAIASKHITSSQTGEKKLLVLVAARGSWGPEWLSNLQMSLSSSFVEGTEVGEGDHTGFSGAARDLCQQIYSYIEKLQEIDPSIPLGDVSLMLCGHSRGGAMANLSAAYFDQLANEFEGSEVDDAESLGDEYIHRESIYSYSFASPEVTDNEDCRDALYDNIFNLVNPADIVPRMPLTSWGYSRYGRDLWLPEYGMAGFEEKYEQAADEFYRIVGSDALTDPSDVAEIEQIVDRLGEFFPTLSDAQDPLAAVKVVWTFFDGHDFLRILRSHACSFYLSWMNVVDASDLRANR